MSPFKTVKELTMREPQQTLDDIAAARVTSAAELRQRCTENFYFGCESGVPW
jgi:hypothetical protein